MQGNRFQNFTDMIDGGGVGQSGPAFEGGGMISRLGNNMRAEYAHQRQIEEQRRAQMFRQWQQGLRTRQPFGGPHSALGTPRYQQGGFPRRDAMDGYKGILDMFDGGGAGQSGEDFKGGGLLSSLLNTLEGKG